MGRPPFERSSILGRRRQSLGTFFEEYRDRIAQGETAGLRAWYIRQTISFVNPAGLRRALFPDRLLWTLTAAVAEASLLFVAPMLAGVSNGWPIFCLVAVVLSITGALAMRTAAERRAVFQTAGLWILPFLAIALLTLRLPVFTPAPGVVAFFACAAISALHASERTGKLDSGIATAILVGALIAAFTAITTALLHYRHPPFATLPIVPGAAAILGVVGGSFGSHFRLGATDCSALRRPDAMGTRSLRSWE